MTEQSISFLGPHTVLAIDDHVRGRIVAQRRVPVILKDEQRFAVHILAPPGNDLQYSTAQHTIASSTIGHKHLKAL